MAAASAPKFVFRLLQGMHHCHDPVLKCNVSYKPKDLIKTDENLAAKFGRDKFELVSGPKDGADVADPDEEESLDDPGSAPKNGVDKSSLWPIAAQNKLAVRYRPGKLADGGGYYIHKEDDLDTPLNPKGLAKNQVTEALVQAARDAKGDL